jgi:hypothetical protein
MRAMTARQRRRVQRKLEKQQRRRAAAGGRAESPPRAPEASRSRGLLAAEERRRRLDLVESFDGFAGLRGALGEIAERDDQWAGIPMPLDGQRLVIEPTYPKAAELSAIGVPTEGPHELDDAKVRNSFWSDKKRGEVIIFEKDGKIDWGVLHGVHHFAMDLETMRSSDAWGVEQEANALQLLATLLPHRQFKQYLLTGMFVERSRRSGLSYAFRRLKPTVVIDARDPNGKSTRILCTLCLHPIAYYSGSWAGAMAPTDDVVAHLMLMRGDEPMLWRRANQHAPWRPESGLGT